MASGSSQPFVNDQAGAKMPLALVCASATIALGRLCLTGLLCNVPSVVLAANVLAAVKGLIDRPALRRLWRVSRFEFGVAMVACVTVLGLSILKGVSLAAVVSPLLAAMASPWRHRTMLMAVCAAGTG